jgi:hypothetical protein
MVLLACVMSSTIAQAQHSNEAMAMSVTWARFMPLALSPRNEPQLPAPTNDPLLFSRYRGMKTALVAQHSRYRHYSGLHKITLPALAFELSL